MSITDDMREMFDGWVQLPKDADGEYIHIGDVMERDGKVLSPVSGIGDGSVIVGVIGVDSCISEIFNPSKLHRHKLTVEDVLRDFGDRYCDMATDSDEERELFAQYAAKLRLVEE